MTTRKEKDAAAFIVHETLINEFVLPSCINCSHFTKDETCDFYNARPPARVIVLSCGQGWVLDLPF